MTGARVAGLRHRRGSPAPRGPRGPGGGATGLVAHTPDDVRAAEAAVMARLPDGALMQRAAAGLAAAVAAELRRGRGRPRSGGRSGPAVDGDRGGRVGGARVVLLVGGGNNGGDALYAGARLARRGARVDAVLTTGGAHAGGTAALLAAGGRVHDATTGATASGDDDADAAAARGLIAAADVVVDGLLGIGGRGGLRGAAAAVVAAVPPGTTVVAVDLPSGVDPATGETPGPHARADVTVTFGTGKPALLLPPGDAAAGRVQVVDIGLDADLADAAPAATRLGDREAAALWPVPGPRDDKYSRGVVGVVAGGATYTGAAVLACGAAVRSGAGMVRYLGPEAAAAMVRSRWPETVGPGRVQAWVLGPGVDPDDVEQADRVASALASGEPAVVDAGALGLLAPDHRTGVPAVRLLTPHAGELARLLGAYGEPVDRADVEAAPLRHARRAADLTRATVLLKGATSLVVEPSRPGEPQGRVRSQRDGPHWLATAGSGDVLAGLAGTLLAARLDPLDAASLAVVVHGRAGHLASGGGPVSAGSVLDAVPAAVASLLRGRGTALGH